MVGAKMTANEMADRLENELNIFENRFVCDAATMLRQQQAEIETLKTHPVKELTDEEIRHIQAQCHLKNVGYDNFIMRFARAILRKAQEK
jgi:hypothetical protein